MPSSAWYADQAQLTLKRLLPKLQTTLATTSEADIFISRLSQEFPRLFQLLHDLYANRYDFFYHLEAILHTAAQMYIARPQDLRELDKQRETQPQWFQSEKMMGGVCYVDLFADNLAGVRAKIPYFQELGLTYLHLMPLFKVPLANNDGGYAVSDYRSVNPDLGTMEELASLAADLRHHGISLVLDFVFNHTSHEHEWARKAAAGDPDYVDYYYLFDDRTMPDLYERHLREIFPEQDPGSFTYFSEIGKWVWTTFRRFQWDLNYSNPQVFNAMLGEMLFLANVGVEVLRLDAVAFIWKQIGTSCENLPQAHMIIQAYNALAKIVAPSLIFKSEAIVHPADVAQYVGMHECPISYNPTLMALLWESLATRKITLLRHSMSHYFDLPPNSAWVNYVRVHDDIGWTFADEDAGQLGINPFDHRQFLNRFYTGEFPGSFAKGLPFNYNPINHDMRISGMAASLAGIEKALELGDTLYLEDAIRRLLLIYSVILSAGGIPLVYLGDEIALCNDYSYLQDPAKADDSRWVHRPKFDWGRAQRRHDPATIEGRVFTTLQRLITIRRQTPAFANGHTTFFDVGNPHILAFIRKRSVLILSNFSEDKQAISREVLAAYVPARSFGDLITGESVNVDDILELEPLSYRWLTYSDPMKS